MSAVLERAGPPARILVVDDVRDNRELLALVLTHEGFVVSTAAGGAEALAMVAMELPDLVLMDLRMPDMNGHELAARLKGNPATRKTRMVMLTAQDDSEARGLAMKAGVDDFLTKPIDTPTLCARMWAVLRLDRPLG